LSQQVEQRVSPPGGTREDAPVFPYVQLLVRALKSRFSSAAAFPIFNIVFRPKAGKTKEKNKENS